MITVAGEVLTRQSLPLSLFPSLSIMPAHTDVRRTLDTANSRSGERDLLRAAALAPRWQPGRAVTFLVLSVRMRPKTSDKCFGVWAPVRMPFAPGSRRCPSCAVASTIGRWALAQSGRTTTLSRRRREAFMPALCFRTLQRTQPRTVPTWLTSKMGR